MMVDAIYAPDLSTRVALPVFLGRLPAGFPSPADDYIEGKLDLNRHLIKHPAATFFVRVSGDSMTGAGSGAGSRTGDACTGQIEPQKTERNLARR
jgi:DNA polymerase V